ncbi:hypothetical protein D018_1441B, partial [Vibrio parahaemolyticus VP2007-007]
MLGSPLMATC